MQDVPEEFRRRIGHLVDEARGLIKLLRSVKPELAKPKTDPVYRVALKRLRDDGIRLASIMEAAELLLGTEVRDGILSDLGCSWDQAKRRVDLG